MLSEWKQTSTVGTGGRIEVTIPELHGGEVVQVVVRVDEAQTPPPHVRPLGFLKGRVHLMPDFDAPLEEFEEYT